MKPSRLLGGTLCTFSITYAINDMHGNTILAAPYTPAFHIQATCEARAVTQLKDHLFATGYTNFQVFVSELICVGGESFFLPNNQTRANAVNAQDHYPGLY